MANYYQDKIVLITGGSSGIGRALAVSLARQKAKLILVSRRREALLEVQQECQKYTSDCDIIPFDLLQTSRISDLATQAMNIHGDIDVLINNAGVSQRSLTADTSLEVDREIMELDYFATITLTKALLPHFIQKGNKHIIVISSVSGLMGFPMRSAYSAAKHALHGFFETLQTEIKTIHTTIVCPGRVNTPISLSALTGDGQPHAIMDEGQKNGISAETCAEKIISAAEKRKKKIIIAQEEKLLLFIKHYFPALFYKIAHKKGMQPH